MFKKFGEFLNEEWKTDQVVNSTEDSTFLDIDSEADVVKSKFKHDCFVKTLKQMQDKNPNIQSWRFVQKDGKGIKSVKMEYTSSSPHCNFQDPYGIELTMKCKIKAETTKYADLDFKMIYGDEPEYEFKLVYWFTNSGKQAIQELFTTQDVSIDQANNNVTSMKSTDKFIKSSALNIHKMLYKDWVIKQKDHPLRGHYTASKYGL